MGNIYTIEAPDGTQYDVEAPDSPAQLKSTNPIGNFVGGVAHGIVEPFAKLAQGGPLASVSRGLGSMAGGQGFNPKDTGVNLPLYGHVEAPKTANEYIGNAIKAGSMFAVPEVGLSAPFAAYSGGQAISENKPAKDVINKILIGAGIGKGIEIGAPIVGSGVYALGKAIPQGLKTAGLGLVEEAIKRFPKYASYGANPAEGIVGEGITGGSKEELQFQLQNRLEELGQQKQAILKDAKNVGKYINGSDLMNALEKAKSTAIGTPNSEALVGRIQGAIDQLEALTKDTDLNHIPIDEADILKQTIGKWTKFTGNPSDDLAYNSALKQTYGNLMGKIEEVEPAVKEPNRRFSNVLSANQALENGDMFTGKEGLFSRIGKRAGVFTALGSIPAFLSGHPELATKLLGGGLAEEAVIKAANSPTVKTNVAKGLYGAGEGLENAGQSVKDILDKIMGKTQPIAPSIIQEPYTPPTRGSGPYAGLGEANTQPYYPTPLGGNTDVPYAGLGKYNPPIYPPKPPQEPIKGLGPVNVGKPTLKNLAKKKRK